MKRIILLPLLFLIVFCHAQTVKISALPVTTTATGVIPIVQGGVTKQLDLSFLASAPVIEIVTSGSPTISNSTTIFIYNNANTTASATLTLPASPVNGQSVRIHFINAVTTLAIAPNTSQTISQYSAPTAIAAGEDIGYTWILSISKWISK